MDPVAGEEVRVQSKAAATQKDKFPARRISATDDGCGTTGGTSEDNSGSGGSDDQVAPREKSVVRSVSGRGARPLVFT